MVNGENGKQLCSRSLQRLGVAVQNGERDFFVSLRLRARNGFNGSAQGCPERVKSNVKLASSFLTAILYE